MPPGRDGIALVRVVRARSAVAVVRLTAREAVDDRLRGFDVGVDDYLAKPFVTAELVARVRAVLRRTGAIGATVQIDELVVDEEAGYAARGGIRLPVTATEPRLLSYLANHRDRVLSNALRSSARSGATTCTPTTWCKSTSVPGAARWRRTARR